MQYALADFSFNAPKYSFVYNVIKRLNYSDLNLYWIIPWVLYATFTSGFDVPTYKNQIKIEEK